MATKFEQIIEHIINENDDKARALFHEIVVEKSRKIYEELGVGDDHDIEGVMQEVDVDDHNPEMVESDEEGVGEFEGEPEIGGDEADDLTADTFVDGDGDTGEVDGEFGDEAEGSEEEQEIEDRVVGLEDAFDELKAEFEQFINAEGEGEEADGEDEEEVGDAEEAEGEAEEEIGDAEEAEGEDEEAEGEADEEEVAEDVVREYIEKVTDKAGTKEASGTNTKSVVAGKNDMGGTAKNLNQGSPEEKGRPTPKSQPLSSEKFQNAPGANAGVKSLKNAPKPDRTKEDSGTNKKSVY